MLSSWWLAGRSGLVVAGGLLLASGQAHWYQAEIIPAELESRSLLLQGRIAGFAAAGQPVEFESYPGLEWPLIGRRVRLTLYDVAAQPQAGELWQFKVRLKAPHGYANPHGSSRRLWLFSRDVSATGYVPISRLNRRLSDDGSTLSLLELRARLRRALERSLTGSPELPFMVGLVVGARDALTPDDRNVLRRTGTSHLLAISGLHVGLIAFLSWWLVRALLLMLAVVFRRCLGPASVVIPACSAITVAGCYALLAGFTVPTQRAFMMVALVLLLTIRRRVYAALHTLAMALLVVLVFNPVALLAPASWLSFLAVALLFVLAQRSGSRWYSPVLTTVRAQWMLSWVLAIPALLFFGEMSVLSLPANLLAIPVFSFVIVPSLLAGMTLISVGVEAGAAMLQFAAAVLALVLRWLGWLASHDWGMWSVAVASPFVAMAASLGLLLIGLPRPLRIIPAGGVLLALAIGGSARQPAVPELYVVDVGQGLAVLLRTEESNLLYDTGPAWPGNDAGHVVLSPLLKSLGIGRLDTLIISHGDTDHTGGLKSVLDAFVVKQIYTQSGSRQYGRETMPCRRGTAWQSGSVKMRFLHPRETAGWSDNNASCVLEIVINGNAFLLPGDIESAAEQVLVARDIKRRYQVIVAPHHGSRTSSSARFIAAVKPELVVYPVGYRNRWGFPAADIDKNWLNAGSCTISLAQSGGLRFRVNPESGFRLQEQAAYSYRLPWVVRGTEGPECRLFKPL